MTSQQIINGRVTKIGYYSDTLPSLVITIPKCAAGGLSISEGKRVDLQFSMNGEDYHAGIRTTPKAKVITICPDLRDKAGNDIRLTDLLLRHNIQHRDTVAISIVENVMVVIL